MKNKVNKFPLLILILLFGGFGIHRFYLGNYKLGSLYMLFFWTGIPFLAALVEFIVFTFTSEEKINNSYAAHESAARFAFIPVFIIYLGIYFLVMISMGNFHISDLSFLITKDLWLSIIKVSIPFSFLGLLLLLLALLLLLFNDLIVKPLSYKRRRESQQKEMQKWREDYERRGQTSTRDA